MVGDGPSQLMDAARTPRSKHYDGAIYGRLIEPMLGGVHGYVAEHLPDGERVLEACCGTGGLARRFAAQGRRVVGVDLAPKNIAFARRRLTDGLSVSFEVGDVSQLPLPAEGPYDVATIVLALHEMPADARPAVLERLLGIARQVMILDFAVPMPRNLAGLRNRFVEFTAGVEHFTAFRDFTRRGGLPRLLEDAGAEVTSDERIDGKTLQVVVARRPRTAA